MAKILVADGDLTSQVAMGKALAADGHVTRTAFTGEEAVQRFSGDRFELLITELSLPKLDGVTLIGRLRERGLLEGVPFILVSSANEREAYRVANELGALDVITKPIDPPTVQARVRRAIDRFRTGQTGLHSDAMKRFGLGSSAPVATAAVIRPAPQGPPVLTLPARGGGGGGAPPAPLADDTPVAAEGYARDPEGEPYGSAPGYEAPGLAGAPTGYEAGSGSVREPAPEEPLAAAQDHGYAPVVGESSASALGLPGEFGLPGELPQATPAGSGPADSGAIRAAEIATAFGIAPGQSDAGASGGFDPFFSPAEPVKRLPAGGPQPGYPAPPGPRETPPLISPSQFSTPPLLAGPAGAEATRRRLRGEQPVYEMPPSSAQRQPQAPSGPASPAYTPGQTSAFAPFLVPQPQPPQPYAPGQSSAFAVPAAPPGYQPGYTGSFAPLPPAAYQPGHTGAFAPLPQASYQPGHTGAFAPLPPGAAQGPSAAQPQPLSGESSGSLLGLDTSRPVRLPSAPGQAFIPPSIARPDCEGALGPIQLAELVRLMFLGRKSGFLDAAYNEYRAEIAFVMGEIIRVGIYVGGREVNRSLVALKTACGWKQGRYRIVFAEIQQTAALVKSTAAFLAEVFGKAGTSEDYLGPSTKTGAGSPTAGIGPGVSAPTYLKPPPLKQPSPQKQPPPQILPGKFPPPGQMR